MLRFMTSKECIELQSLIASVYSIECIIYDMPHCYTQC